MRCHNGVDCCINCVKHLVRVTHEQALKSGFWACEECTPPCECAAIAGKNIPEKIALMHSELSEALEEYRKGAIMREADVYYEVDGIKYPLSVCKRGTYNSNSIPEKHKPEGIAIELADCIIRILDFCGAYGIDIAEAIQVKMAYNATRPYKHGKVC